MGGAEKSVAELIQSDVHQFKISNTQVDPTGAGIE